MGSLAGGDHRAARRGTATARALLADLQRGGARGRRPGPGRGRAARRRSPGSRAPPEACSRPRPPCIAARRAPHPGGTGIFEELSGHFRLLDGLDEASLDDLVQRTFAPLLDYDARHRATLYETLRTLFEHRLAVQETADALHIHRNTLQKRLAHVEQLLAIDLSDLDAIVDVRLGLHAAELLGEPLACPRRPRAAPRSRRDLGGPSRRCARDHPFVPRVVAGRLDARPRPATSFGGTVRSLARRRRTRPTTSGGRCSTPRRRPWPKS